MGCYGIGISRLMGVIVEKQHDEKGIIWPEAVAPFTAHLIEIGGASAKELYTGLRTKGVEVLYDDRDVSPGEKFNDADLIGVPLRIVVSPKTGDSVEVKKRDEKEARVITKEELMKLFA